MMGTQGDATCDVTDTTRNGFHEGRLETQINMIAFRIPTL